MLTSLREYLFRGIWGRNSISRSWKFVQQLTQCTTFNNFIVGFSLENILNLLTSLTCNIKLPYILPVKLQQQINILPAPCFTYFRLPYVKRCILNASFKLNLLYIWLFHSVYHILNSLKIVKIKLLTMLCVVVVVGFYAVFFFVFF